MNLENFAEYLKYPSRLYQLPYEELKSLTLQYPYCTNFHMLLLIKSKQEGHPDLEKNLAKAATYSVDRSHLRALMEKDQAEVTESLVSIGEDEILELKDLFTLDAELEKIPVSPLSLDVQEQTVSELPISPEQPAVEHTSDSGLGLDAEDPFDFETPTEAFAEQPEPLLPTAPGIAEESIETDTAIPDAAGAGSPFVLPQEIVEHVATISGITALWEAPESPPEAPQKEPAFQLSEAEVLHQVAISRVVDGWWEQQQETQTIEWDIVPAPSKTKIATTVVEQQAPVVSQAAAPPKVTIAPTPKTQFKSFQRRYRRPALKVEQNPASPVGAVPKAKTAAEASVREDLGVVSETLASLLVQQEQYDRAIKMYEHLSLLIPEKNAYFAAKIDAIKNL